MYKRQEYKRTVTENLVKCGETQERASELAAAIIAQEAEELENGMTSEAVSYTHLTNDQYFHQPFPPKAYSIFLSLPPVPFLYG